MSRDLNPPPVSYRHTVIQTADGFRFLTDLRIPPETLGFRRAILPASAPVDPNPPKFEPLSEREYQYVGVTYREIGDKFVVRVFREVQK